MNHAQQYYPDNRYQRSRNVLSVVNIGVIADLHCAIINLSSLCIIVVGPVDIPVYSIFFVGYVSSYTLKLSTVIESSFAGSNDILSLCSKIVYFTLYHS